MAKTTLKTRKTASASAVSDVVEEKAVKPTPKKFDNMDEIPCVSIRPGELFVEGKRSDELYTFAEMNDEQFIRYDDLMYLIRRKDAAVYEPRFIIQDKEFLAQHKDIEKLYSSLYSASDLKDVLKLPPKELRKRIASLPEGAKDSLKIIAATAIDRGSLDSIQRIKVLDEAFGTEMIRKVSAV